MTEIKRFSGVLVPAVTPFNDDLSVDAERYVALCAWLLDEGADGLAVFGTTSEAASLSLHERMALLERLIASGAPAGRLMPGIGLPALPEAAALTRHALAQGCGGVLALPPYYYKGVSDDGLVAYFSELIERVGDDRLRMYLYHIPQMSGVAIPIPVVARLVKAYPTIIAGLKDSAGDWEATKAYLAAFPDLAIFPSSEGRVFEGLDLGAAGCISASANINVRAIRALIHAHGTPRAAELNVQVSAVRAAAERYPLIPAMKALIARASRDQGWARCRPPLVGLDEAKRKALFADMDRAGLTMAANGAWPARAAV